MRIRFQREIRTVSCSLSVSHPIRMKFSWTVFLLQGLFLPNFRRISERVPIFKSIKKQKNISGSSVSVLYPVGMKFLGTALFIQRMLPAKYQADNRKGKGTNFRGKMFIFRMGRGRHWGPKKGHREAFGTSRKAGTIRGGTKACIRHSKELGTGSERGT